ncbi:MAG: hypothetical protein AAFU49_04205 [Pseudomonadota bacterium]
MKTIDDIKYPNNPERMLAHPKIGPLFRAHAKKTLIEENIEFIRAIKRGRDPKSHYETFFSLNGTFALNISSDNRETANKLANAGNWTPSDWDDVYTEAETMVRNHLEQDSIPKFFSSAGFKSHHLENLRADIKLPKKLLDELGVTDKAAVTDMLALFKSDRNAGEKAARTLVKKKKTRLSSKEVISKVKKFFKF